MRSTTPKKDKINQELEKSEGDDFKDFISKSDLEPPNDSYSSKTEQILPDDNDINSGTDETSSESDEDEQESLVAGADALVKDIFNSTKLSRATSIHSPFLQELQQKVQEEKQIGGSSTSQLWERLTSVCQKHSDEDPRLELLRRAILNYKNNISTTLFADIETLDELLTAQQKYEYLNDQFNTEYIRVSEKLKNLGKSKSNSPEFQILRRKKEAYEALKQAIIDSRADITLSEILIEGSPFLSEEIGSDQQTDTDITIESALNAKSGGWSSEATSKIALDNVRNNLIDPNAIFCGATVALKAKPSSDVYDQTNHEIATELLRLLREHEQNHSKHLVEFKRLCDDVSYLTNTSQDHQKTYRLIRHRIKEAYAKQERKFRKPSFSFLSEEKTKADFKQALDKDKQAFPRALRGVRKFSKVQIKDPLLDFSENELISLLAKDPNARPGKRIKKGTRLADTNIKLTKSVDIDENQFQIGSEVETVRALYFPPGKKQGVIGAGSWGEVKDSDKIEVQYIDESLWVKKSSQGKQGKSTKEQMQEEIEAIKNSVPELEPSNLFTKEGTDHYWFYMKNAGSVNLNQIMSGEVDIDLNGNDILGIFSDLLNQNVFTRSNNYIMYDNKPLNVTLTFYRNENGTLEGIKAYGIDHGGTKPVGYAGEIVVSPAWQPDQALNKMRERTGYEGWMVYQTGLIMADLIIGILGGSYRGRLNAFINNHKNVNRVNDPKYIQLLRDAGAQLQIPEVVISLIVEMIETNPKYRIPLHFAQQLLNRYMPEMISMIKNFEKPNSMRKIIPQQKSTYNPSDEPPIVWNTDEQDEEQKVEYLMGKPDDEVHQGEPLLEDAQQGDSQTNKNYQSGSLLLFSGSAGANTKEDVLDPDQAKKVTADRLLIELRDACQTYINNPTWRSKLDYVAGAVKGVLDDIKLQYENKPELIDAYYETTLCLVYCLQEILTKKNSERFQSYLNPFYSKFPDINARKDELTNKYKDAIKLVVDHFEASVDPYAITGYTTQGIRTFTTKYEQMPKPKKNIKPVVKAKTSDEFDESSILFSSNKGNK